MTPLSPNERENRRESFVHAMTGDSPPAHAESDDYNHVRRSKFRFKSKKRSHSTELGDGDRLRKRKREDRSSALHHTPNHRRHHRSKRKAESPRTNQDDDPSAYDDSYDSTARSAQYMDPDAAFRESLFDALADDEGAAYWEGVYGQPIHTYPNIKTGPEGELERMGDEEYAQYVRNKMWEKTHEHVVEERQKREEERARCEAEKKRRERDERRKRTAWDPELDMDSDDEGSRKGYMRDVDEALRRGEQRQRTKKWNEAWQLYLEEWKKFAETVGSKANSEELAGAKSRGVIPWPVDSGRWKHVSTEDSKSDVEAFFRKGPPTGTDLKDVLKIERVRWHPDKMQQRFGAAKLDSETVKAVTMVFQVVDRLWNEVKDNK